jgi:hypothetical protein
MLMEDCTICFNNKSNKVLPCSHSLCSNCCVRLNVSICPYCRQVFIFNSEEIKQRIKLGILNGYKWDAPPRLAFIPEELIENRQLDNNIENEINHERFSRVRKNMYRRRRRTLTFEEVLEKRQQIKTKKARHWEKKNNRLVKTNWWEN